MFENGAPVHRTDAAPVSKSVYAHTMGLRWRERRLFDLAALWRRSLHLALYDRHCGEIFSFT